MDYMTRSSVGEFFAKKLSFVIKRENKIDTKNLAQCFTSSILFERDIQLQIFLQYSDVFCKIHQRKYNIKGFLSTGSYVLLTASSITNFMCCNKLQHNIYEPFTLYELPCQERHIKMLCL